MAGPALWSFFPTADTQALLPSSLGLTLVTWILQLVFSAVGKMAGFLVSCGLTQNLGAGSCSLQAQEAQLSPRTLWLPRNPSWPCLCDPGAPWSPPSLLQHPSSPPQRRQGNFHTLETLQVQVQTSPSLSPLTPAP